MEYTLWSDAALACSVTPMAAPLVPGLIGQLTPIHDASRPSPEAVVVHLPEFPIKMDFGIPVGQADSCDTGGKFLDPWKIDWP
ncbi:MAG TPA: hypothetical protein VK956_09605 [Verrucomicrobium sp.]|nr:hypothetical protein [Verrucomicrobium sp.]